MKKRLTIAILQGGISAERGVSLQTGAAVARACRQLGHRVRRFDPRSGLPKLLRARKEIDVVFPALHGRGGEDGILQAFLEFFSFRFVGSGTVGMVNSFDKIRAKKIYRAARLPVARDLVLTKNAAANGKKVLRQLGLPCFVKPTNEGSSFGASLVREKNELSRALTKAFRFGEKVLVEEFIAGTEISAGVLEKPDGGLLALPLVEICPKKKFFDLHAKYNPAFCEEIVPARISKELTRKAQTLAKKAHRALKLRHLSRTDMLVRRGKIYLLETNTLPGFTAHSLYPKEARAAGLEFPTLVEQLIRLAAR